MRCRSRDRLPGALARHRPAARAQGPGGGAAPADGGAALREQGAVESLERVGSAQGETALRGAPQGAEVGRGGLGHLVAGREGVAEEQSRLDAIPSQPDAVGQHDDVGRETGGASAVVRRQEVAGVLPAPRAARPTAATRSRPCAGSGCRPPTGRGVGEQGDPVLGELDRVLARCLGDSGSLDGPALLRGDDAHEDPGGERHPLLVARGIRMTRSASASASSNSPRLTWMSTRCGEADAPRRRRRYRQGPARARPRPGPRRGSRRRGASRHGWRRCAPAAVGSGPVRRAPRHGRAAPCPRRFPAPPTRRCRHAVRPASRSPAGRPRWRARTRGSRRPRGRAWRCRGRRRCCWPPGTRGVGLPGSRRPRRWPVASRPSPRASLVGGTAHVVRRGDALGPPQEPSQCLGPVVGAADQGPAAARGSGRACRNARRSGLHEAAPGEGGGEPGQASARGDPRDVGEDVEAHRLVHDGEAAKGLLLQVVEQS